MNCQNYNVTDENFLPLGCGTTPLSKQSLNFWTTLSTLKGNSTMFLQNSGCHLQGDALSYLRRMQFSTTLLWKHQHFTMSHIFVNFNVTHNCIVIDDVRSTSQIAWYLQCHKQDHLQKVVVLTTLLLNNPVFCDVMLCH